MSVFSDDRRLTLLRGLAEAPGRQANDLVLQRVLAMVGHRASHDMVRADIAWLAEHELVRLEKLPLDPSGEIWIASLTGAGEDVASGASTHPGVARPALP